MHEHLDMSRYNSYNYLNYSRECVQPRRPRRKLPPLLEDMESSHYISKTKSKNFDIKMVQKKRHSRSLHHHLPAVPEHDGY